LVEWLAEHYTEHGTDLQFITNKSSEGFQFVKGFSGIGGFLRFKFDTTDITANDEYVDNDQEFI